MYNSDMENTAENIIEKMEEIFCQKGHCMIALDGRCASGKSTLGELIAEKTGASLVHMDDFFLRPEQRTAKRYATPGENVDHERFLEEVLIPLSRRETVSYHPFDCNTMRISDDIKTADGAKMTVIEGSYSHHPSLRKYYDLTVFVTAEKDTQLKRIRKRNPDKVKAFEEKWIPYEELYFSSCDVQKHADLTVDTTNLF